MSRARTVLSRLRRLRRAALAAGLVVAVAYLVVVVVLPSVIPYPRERLDERATARVLRDRDGEPIRVLRDRAGRRHVPVRLDRVSRHLVDAVIAVEDKRFRDHDGVDELAVGRAAWLNVSSRRIVSGASTITMQLARLVEPRPRTMSGKAVEAFRALQLERTLDKDEILERYLDRVPFGRNLRGVEAAALVYFGKSAGRLDLGEASLLAGLPQSPTRLDPVRNPAAARVRRGHVLDRMLEEGVITPAERERERRREPAVAVHHLPFVAPHFAEIARGRAATVDATTTLDRSLQDVCERLLRLRLETLGDVEAGAVVVIDNTDASVRALIGGPGWEHPRWGRLDLSRRPRSPGSALKPFLFAAALERGDIVPETLLLDVPTEIAGYAPGNFDLDHRGLVPAGEALRHSLNVPAIRLLRRVGAPRLLEILERLGVRRLRGGAGDHGLALVLGSAEVGLLDLAAAYSVLAAQGRRRPLRFLEAEPVLEGEAAIPGGVALQVAGMLAVRDGPRTVAGESVIAMKTGTSNGRRDAWCFGYDPDWTVGVWLGNPGGRPSERLVGAVAAAPLVRDIVRELRARRPARWYAETAGTVRIRTCAATGLAASPRCPDVREGRAAAGARPLRTCDRHREILVDRETGEWRCSRCVAGRTVAREVRLVLPREARDFLGAGALDAAGRTDVAPAHAAGCTAHAVAPRIRLPVAGRTYPRRLPLRSPAVVDWFVDGRPAGRGASLDVVVAPGTHRVRAVGASGRSRAVEVRAE